MQTPAFPAADPSLTLPERLLRVFYAPRRSFAALGQDPDWIDWFTPILLVCLVGIASHFLTRDLVFDPEAPAVKEQLENLSEEKRQEQLKSMEAMRARGWVTVPVGALTSLVAVGGVLFLLARFLFQSEVSYRQMLVVKGYASLVVGVEWAARTLLMLARQTPVVHTGPGVLVSEESARTFAGQVLLAINFFDVWQAAVMGIGLAVVARVPARKAVFALLALWGFWVLGMGALGSAALSVPPGPGEEAGP
jgi:hypothetical protein